MQKDVETALVEVGRTELQRGGEDHAGLQEVES